MDFHTEQLPQTTVVSLHGRLDSASAVEAEQQFLQLLESRPQRLLIDLAAVDFVSSAGLRVLLIVAKGLKQSGGALQLCGLPPAVQEVFDVSGFSRIFEILPTRSDALGEPL